MNLDACLFIKLSTKKKTIVKKDNYDLVVVKSCNLTDSNVYFVFLWCPQALINKICYLLGIYLFN